MIFTSFTQGFLTDHEEALQTLYAEDAENSRHFNICLNMMATRISTVFASLKVKTIRPTPLFCLILLLFLSSLYGPRGLCLLGISLCSVSSCKVHGPT